MNYELISFIIEVFFIIYINWNIKKKISIAIVDESHNIYFYIYF